MLSPASSSSLNTVQVLDKATCAICRRQVSRYTCPSCNTPYCSLTCFRSIEHAQCSEVFYKRQLESEIQTQPSVSVQERRGMLEMLKKFEEEGNDDLIGEEDEDERDDLVERLGGIDIDSATDIWNALTPEEREAFLSKIRDPTTAQELLRNIETELDIVLPWWEAPDPEIPADEPPITTASRSKYGRHPTMEEIPRSLLKRPGGPDSGPPLLYNICAVFISYAYVTRHLGISPLSNLKEEDDRTSARQLIRSLVPFLTEKRSTVLFHSMDDVVSDMWPRLVDGNKADRASFVLFLRDAARLLSPRKIIMLGTASSSSNSELEETPQRDALLALSDLIAMVRLHGEEEVKETPASLKLRFYAAQVVSLPSQLLGAFSAEVGARARSVEVEAEGELDVRGEERT